MPVPFGVYVLERWLARGGMANVFLATYSGPLGFEREAALKVILPEYAHHSGFIGMFLDEARLTARLTHPNIVQVHDLGQVRGYFYIAMEYVAGSSLSAALARARQERRRMAAGLAMFIVESVLEALCYAHQRRDRLGRPLGIVHRDISPQNILLSFDGQVKLADFGVARANVNLQKTATGVVKGKYSHMAPEQCLGLPLDERADLFAVGIVLHELLTGKPLFARSTLYETMKAVLEGPIPAPSEVTPVAPRELDALVLKALARDPAKRFQSAREFLAALKLMTRQLQMLDDRYELRAFLEAIYRRGRHNLAGAEEPGVPVTEDRISQILKGTIADKVKDKDDDLDILTLEPSRVSQLGAPSEAEDGQGRDSGHDQDPLSASDPLAAMAAAVAGAERGGRTTPPPQARPAKPVSGPQPAARAARPVVHSDPAAAARPVVHSDPAAAARPGGPAGVGQPRVNGQPAVRTTPEPAPPPVRAAQAQPVRPTGVPRGVVSDTPTITGVRPAGLQPPPVVPPRPAPAYTAGRAQQGAPAAAQRPEPDLMVVSAAGRSNPGRPGVPTGREPVRPVVGARPEGALVRAPGGAVVGTVTGGVAGAVAGGVMAAKPAVVPTGGSWSRAQEYRTPEPPVAYERGHALAAAGPPGVRDSGAHPRYDQRAWLEMARSGGWSDPALASGNKAEAPEEHNPWAELELEPTNAWGELEIEELDLPGEISVEVEGPIG